ncbi:MAG: SRPBCC family protein [Acidimicrobiia bacterium]
MPSMEVSEIVERPVAEVWAYIEDPRNETEWQSAARERELLDDGEIGKGTRYRGVDGFLGRRLTFVWEVTEYDPEDRLVIQATEGPMETQFAFELTPVDGGTKVTYGGEAENGFGGLFGRLLDPVVTGIFQRESQNDLAKLKAILEANS